MGLQLQPLGLKEKLENKKRKRIRTDIHLHPFVKILALNIANNFCRSRQWVTWLRSNFQLFHDFRRQASASLWEQIRA